MESMLSGDTARVIWVTVSVEDSQTWRLVDHDLETSLELSPSLALLGGRTVVKTPAREVQVEVDSSTSSGKTIVVAEEGLRAGGCLPGDLVLKTAIKVPSKLSWRQLRVIKKFASLEAPAADKLVTGVSHEVDHRLEVNVVTADRITNNTVRQECHTQMEKPITQTVRDKLGIKSPVRESPQYPYHRIFGL